MTFQPLKCPYNMDIIKIWCYQKLQTLFKILPFTSQIVDEIGEFHLAFWFDTFVVKVRIEHDDGKR